MYLQAPLNKIKNIFSYTLYVLSFLILVVPCSAFAETPSPAKTGASVCKDGLCRPANYNQEWASSMLQGTVPGIINGILTRVLPLVGVIFLVMFVWGGIQWLTSAGDAKKVSGARTTLFNAIIGVTVVSLAYFIVSQFLRLISI